MKSILVLAICVCALKPAHGKLTLESHEQKIESLLQRVSNVEEENAKLKADNAAIEVTNKKLTKLLADKEIQKRLLLDSNNQYPSSLSPQVAFSAALNHHVTLGTHQTIEYENVITNIGNGYSLKHGHFIAPVKGIYIISVTGYNYNDFVTFLELVKDGNVVINLLMDGRNGMNSGLTETLFLVLEKGEMVWVRGRAGGKLWGDPKENCNSFSGYLLATL